MSPERGSAVEPGSVSANTPKVTNGLNDVYWMTPEAFDDGAALFEAICKHELEGIVAKRRSSPYRPGARGWIKRKNRDYWRYEMERESAISRPRLK